MLEQAKTLYEKHKQWWPLSFFVLGFLFDMVMFTRIDDPVVILQQAVYLILIAALVSAEFLHSVGKFDPGTGLFFKAWRYREEAVHFMFGSLLNMYTLFYFMSGTLATSFGFMTVLVAILLVSEFKRFGEMQTTVHMALWALCLISYFVYVVPILMGFMGIFPFLLAFAASGGCSYFVYWYLRRKNPEHHSAINRRLLLPYVSVHCIFLILYFLNVIPPVPLSVTYMGIFHDVKKENGQFLLSHTNTSWKFWQNGDQDFSARPGDKIYCFAQVFSPTSFKDSVKVRWLYFDKKLGWQSSDAIPMEITGGRAEGFRGFTAKTNYSPGHWRCQVETNDNRVVGRIGFRVSEDFSVEPRETRVLNR